MQEGVLKELIALLSLKRVVAAAVAILFGWLLLVAIHFSLDRLATRFPRWVMTTSSPAFTKSRRLV